jgi:CDP-diacylglycerol--glycerol-3-phosphate 3-phosphatidyltransferase
VKTNNALWNIPNLLSLSRVPLAALLCVCLHYSWPAVGLVVFVVAALTDWADGWWARKYGPLSPIGRSLDPLTDKVLIASAFVFLIRVPNAGIEPWMVTIVVIREILITGLRGIVEAMGANFSADWFGKLKMVLQCAVIIGVLLKLTMMANDVSGVDVISITTTVLLYVMLLATVGSALQYFWKATKVLGKA